MFAVDESKNHVHFRIFDDVWVLKNHTGLVLFLEEDHYVAEDFLYMLKLLNAAVPRACSKCSLITLGNYLKTYNFHTDARKVRQMWHGFFFQVVKEMLNEGVFLGYYSKLIDCVPLPVP